MAVRLFSELVYGVNLNSNFLSNYRKERKLPDVLSIVDVWEIIVGIDNIKHKTIISLIYSCGLRTSECVNIKIRYIDSERMLIKVEQPKGIKDRFVPLSEKCFLYYGNITKHINRNYFLFEGQIKDSYSTRIIQAILKAAVIKK